MKITIDFLKELKACKDGVIYYKNNNFENFEHDVLIKKLQLAGKHAWTNWLIVKLLSRANKVKYAIFAAESVLHFFEKKYPSDSRPAQAIAAAKKYLKDKSTASAAYAAASAAYAASAAAYAASAAYVASAASAAAYAAYAAYAASYAAYASDAAYAASYAAYTADAATYAAYAADAADAAASDDARKKHYDIIIKYGLELLKEQDL